MVIDFCIFCHMFQRRLCWQLSSIYEQIDPPDIIVNIASLENEGDPRTEDVVGYFRSLGMNINHIVYKDKEDIALRGLVRNRQIQETNGDWLYFADCDHVYSPNFFNELSNKIEEIGYTEKVVAALPRIYTDKKETNKIVNSNSDKLYIEKAYDIANNITREVMNDDRMRKVNSKVAGGGMQVVNRKALYKRTGGWYCNPDNYENGSPDRHLFNKGQKARSDNHFRNKMRVPAKFFMIDKQIHLSHNRDAEFRKHLTEQR